jgi:hypothetical protein
MASIVLTLAGSAAGNALLPGIGGAILGGIGGALGGVIDRAVFGGGGRTVKGPRLDQLRIQDSSYGNGIPIIYGRNRLSGNVIWASDLHETITSEEVGGKGGGGGSTVEKASYSVDCAIAIGEGPIGSISTIWADSKEIYAGGQWKTGTLHSVEFYLGTASQGVSPIMESALGTGFVPAYRGIAYMVVEGLSLAISATAFPISPSKCNRLMIRWCQYGWAMLIRGFPRALTALRCRARCRRLRWPCAAIPLPAYFVAG